MSASTFLLVFLFHGAGSNYYPGNLSAIGEFPTLDACWRAGAHVKVLVEKGGADRRHVYGGRFVCLEKPRGQK